MSESFRLLGICGSLRKASTNMGLLRCAKDMVPQVQLEIADLSQIPFYNADLASQGLPAPVKKLIEQATAAQGLLLSCPEYNYSMAPALKNALDWLSKEPDNQVLNAKPIAIMGAGGGMGTSRAQYHLRQSCVYLNLIPLNKPEFFTNAFTGAFNDQGDLVDEAQRNKVAELVQALLAKL